MIIPASVERGALGILDLASLVPPPPGFSYDPIQRLKMAHADARVGAYLPPRLPLEIFHLQPTAFMNQHLLPPTKEELALKYFQY